MTTLAAHWLLEEPGSQPARRDVAVHLEHGRIRAVEPLERPPVGARRLVLPALANAHDHARTFRSATLGAFARPLESWLPFLGIVPGVDPYLCAATSFARSARRGVAALMVHYTRIQGTLPYLEEALAVARAAHDVGLHIGFAVAMRDRHGIAYCEDVRVLEALHPDVRSAVAHRLAAPATSAAEQITRVDELNAVLHGAGLDRQVTLQYGPTGVQWCSDALLEAIACASADTGRPVHMHLLETQYQRQWADATHPDGIVRHLGRIGLLNPRLTLAHCTWARPDELALLAEHGVTIAVNTSSNLGIRSGIAPVAEMLRQGCRIAMGLDGLALDEDDDALREMRLTNALHRGWGYDETMSPAQLWAFAAHHGRRSVGAVDEGGRIATGEPADLMVLDWESLDDDGLWPDIDPLELLLARAHGSHLRQLFVGGRLLVDEGRVITVDEDALKAEMLAQVRSRLRDEPQWARWREQVQVLAEDLGPFYRQARWSGCC